MRYMTNNEIECAIRPVRKRLECNLSDMLETLSEYERELKADPNSHMTAYGLSHCGKTVIRRKILEVRSDLLKISKLLGGREEE